MASNSSTNLPLELIAQQGFLRRLALDLVGRPEEADDLVQEVNLCALQRPPSDATRLRGWLVEVVGRVAARSRWRAALRCERERDAARPEALEDVLSEVESARALFDGLAKLPEAYRRTLLLRYWRDQSPQEIARTTGVPLETVKSRLARARKELRDELERRQFGGRASWGAALVALAWPDQGWLAMLAEPWTSFLRRWRHEFAAGVITAALLADAAAPVGDAPWVALAPSQASVPMRRIEPAQGGIPATPCSPALRSIPATPLTPAEPHIEFDSAPIALAR